MVPPHLANAPNVNHLWAGLLVEELVRQGTTFFVVCPGSRSAPLAVAVAQCPRAEALVHWDERAAAFVALGWGRATGRPAAVVTTSGTAVANLLPAAVEADADGVPLLLLTADRPPELRETGANQAVRQPPVFQDVARWALDWPVPTTAVPARWVLSTAAHAAHRARQPPGPVHLNLPFREPLAATPDGTDAAAYLADLGAWARGEEPFTQAAEVQAAVTGVDVLRLDREPLADRLRAAERGVVLYAETGGEPGLGASAAEVARALGWPLLVDVRATNAPTDSDVVAGRYDLVLTSQRARQSLRPEAVLHVGGRLTSKRLAGLLADARPALYVHASDAPGRDDPAALVTDRVRHRVSEVVTSLRDDLPGRSGGPAPWLGAWLSASGAAEAVVQEELGSLSEPAVARAVCDLEVPSVVVAASMPVRDVEAYRQWERALPRVVANRGASGIDGTVATAAGLARGSRQPAVVLLGDLALLHDLTSLALLRAGPPVVVVCVNNDGGGIFHRLPIADGPGRLAPDTFERMFGTPHGLTFGHAAHLVGLAYHAPETLEAFEAALDTALRSGASALVEVRTDRDEQAALRRRVEAACAEAVDRTLDP